MGRGLGRVQRSVIDVLVRHPLSDVDQIAMVINKSAGRKSTVAELNSVQKAIKALAARKLIKRDSELSAYGNPRWAVSGR